MKREILRLLKPGGLVLIDTAFMQPLHGDPSHFFNMTSAGLRMVMDGFDVLEHGVLPHQLPSFGLRMQMEAVLPFMRHGAWQARLASLVSDLKESGDELDRDLGVLGQEILSAGVFLLGRKPG
jgi:hypothetical protein